MRSDGEVQPLRFRLKREYSLPSCPSVDSRIGRDARNSVAGDLSSSRFYYRKLARSPNFACPVGVIRTRGPTDCPERAVAATVRCRRGLLARALASKPHSNGTRPVSTPAAAEFCRVALALRSCSVRVRFNPVDEIC